MISQKINVIRKRKGLSQEIFGENVGISRQTISRWELGEIVPNTKNLEKLCEAYNVPLTYFSKSYQPDQLELAIADATANPQSAKQPKKPKLIVDVLLIAAIVLLGFAFIGAVWYLINKLIAFNGDIAIDTYFVLKSIIKNAISIIIISAILIAEIILIKIIIKRTKIKKKYEKDKKFV